MCLLSLYLPGVMPDPDELLNGALANADGSGYALATDAGRLIVRRSMDDPYALISEFEKDRAANLGQPALFHSRFGTGGDYSTYNVHPFKLGSDRRTVVGHNGIFPSVSRSLAKDDRRSDTRKFATEIMPQRFRRLDSDKTIAGLEKFCRKGYTSKLAVITVNPRYRKRWYLINESAGVWAESGAWHSNYDYEPYVPYFLSQPAGTQDGTSGIPGEICQVCAAYGTIDPVTYVCEACRYCADCIMHIAECECYSPSAGARETVTLSGNGYPDAEPLTASDAPVSSATIRAGYRANPPAWWAEQAATEAARPVDAGWAGAQVSFASRVASKIAAAGPASAVDVRDVVALVQDAIRNGDGS